MRLPAFFFPYGGIDGREIGIGLWCLVVYFGQAQAVGQRKCLTVDAFAANDVDVFIAAAMFQRLLQTGEHFGTRTYGGGVGRQDDVPPVGQRAFGQRLKSFTSHDDGVSGGQCFETFQVVGQPEQQFVLVTDGHAAIDGGDDADHIS